METRKSDEGSIFGRALRLSVPAKREVCLYQACAEKQGKFLRRNRMAIFSVSLAVMALMVGLWSEQGAASAAQEVQPQEELAGAEAWRLADKTDPRPWLQSALARADRGEWNLVLAEIDQAMSRTNNADPSLTANLAIECLQLSERATAAGQQKIAERALTEAQIMIKRLEQEPPNAPGHALGLGHALWQLSDTLMKGRRKEEANQALEKALRTFAQAAPRWPRDPYLRQEQAFTHRKIAGLYEAEGQVDQVERESRKAIEIYAALKQQFPNNSWYAHEEAFTTWYMAGFLMRAGRRDTAEAAYREALKLYEKGYAEFPNNPDFKDQLRIIPLQLAAILEAQGKTAEAATLRRNIRQDQLLTTAPAAAAAEGLGGTGTAATTLQAQPVGPAPSIPPRPKNASPEMVDLTGHFLAAITNTWHGEPGNDLAQMPRGVQTFQGVQFDIRGVVALNGGGMSDMPGRYPQHVKDIKVGRKCARIHVLHSTGWRVNDGTIIGGYVLRYTDGSSRVLPIVYGMDVRDWWVGSDEMLETKIARVAWQGRTSKGNPVRIYVRTWDNPLPDREVASLEFMSTMTQCTPFLLAITTEPAGGTPLPQTSLAGVGAMGRNAATNFVTQRLTDRPSMSSANPVRNPDNGHFYQRLNQTMTWPEARDACKLLGGHLATATSREENYFLYENFARDHVCWLGGSDEAREGKWEWVTGEAFVYSNWFSGEPSNGKGIEHFLAMGTHPTFAYRFGPAWNDHEVKGAYGTTPMIYPICEWDSALPGMMVTERPTPAPPPVTAPRIILGVQAAEPGAGGPKAVMGGQAPPIKLSLLDGGQLDLAAHRGTNIVVLVFWASWSPDCSSSMPMLATVAEDYRDKPVAWYAVNLSESAESIRMFLQKTGCKLKVALDQEGAVTERYGIEGVPATVLISKDGRIEAIHAQTKPDQKDALRQELDSLLTGKLLAKP